MQKRTEENRQIAMARDGAEFTKEQMYKLINEQRQIISEMKQTQTQAEMAYANLYRKYAQEVYENSIKQDEMQKAREELAALVNSRSMRITAPLRALKQAVKGWKKW